MNKWLACERCREWYHATCLGKTYVRSNTVFQERNVLWLCDGCERKTAQEWEREEETDKAKEMRHQREHSSQR